MDHFRGKLTLITGAANACVKFNTENDLKSVQCHALVALNIGDYHLSCFRIRVVFLMWKIICTFEITSKQFRV